MDESAQNSAIDNINTMPPRGCKSAWSTFVDGDLLARDGRGDRRAGAPPPRRTSTPRNSSLGNAERVTVGLSSPLNSGQALGTSRLLKEVASDDIEADFSPSTTSTDLALGSGFDGTSSSDRVAHVPPPAAFVASPSIARKRSADVDRSRRGTSWPINRRVDTVLGEVAGEEAVTLRSEGAVPAIDAISDARQRTGSAWPRQALLVLILLILALSLVMLPLNKTDNAKTRTPRQGTDKRG